MTEPIRFGTCLKNVLEQNRISASALARTMGFSSRNSLFRILNNETSYERNAAFFDRLREESGVAFSAEEWELLAQALEVSRVGEEEFRFNRAMSALIMPGQRTPSEGWRVAMAGEEAAQQDFAQVIRRVCQGNGRLIVVNCCLLDLFETIRSQMEGSQLEIEHYFAPQGEAFVDAIAAIQPVLYLQNYHGYLLESVESEAQALYQQHVMLAEYKDGGKRRYLHMSVTAQGRVKAYAHENEALHRYFCGLYRAHRKRMHPVRKLFDRPMTPLDYLKYTEDYYELEKNTSLYCIKMDVPINYIHPDLLLHSVQKGFVEHEFGTAEQRGALLRALYAVQLKRWQNFAQKRKVTHTIFTYEAMRRFALTGQQSDHFFAMAPYTPRERKLILSQIRTWMLEEPYFNVYFFKPEMQTVTNEIGLYEGKGVLFSKGDTGYRLDGDHAETLVSRPEFCHRYKHFFLRKLLVNAVCTKQETLRMLDELIALCGRLKTEYES